MTRREGTALPLKDIIVHLDRGPGCTARFMAAIDLARTHRACLKGLYAISHPYYAPQTALEGDYAEVRSFFINAASKSGVMAEWLHVDWNVIGVPLSEMITFHAYATDLLIIGQPHDGRRVQRGNHEPVEHLILGTGRPVVVFPSDSNTYQFGTNVLVAWRGGEGIDPCPPRRTPAPREGIPGRHSRSGIRQVGAGTRKRQPFRPE